MRAAEHSEAAAVGQLFHPGAVSCRDVATWTSASIPRDSDAEKKHNGQITKPQTTHHYLVTVLLPLPGERLQSTASDQVAKTDCDRSDELLRHYAGPVASDALGLSGIDQPGGPPLGSTAPLRIVVAKPGLDGHDRGAKIVARALRDAGMEVIYTGLHQTPEQIVRTALAEDADAIGLSVLSGAHLTLFARVMELLKAERADDIVVFGGGIIPEADRALLAEMGVAAVFTPGSTMAEVVEWVRANVPKGSSATT